MPDQEPHSTEPQHIEVDSGIAIPNWFLKIAGLFGGGLILWVTWVTVTLSGVSFKLDGLGGSQLDIKANTRTIAIMNERMIHDDGREARDTAKIQELDKAVDEIRLILRQLTK